MTNNTNIATITQRAFETSLNLQIRHYRIQLNDLERLHNQYRQEQYKDKLDYHLVGTDLYYSRKNDT